MLQKVAMQTTICWNVGTPTSLGVGVAMQMVAFIEGVDPWKIYQRKISFKNITKLAYKPWNTKKGQ